MQTATEVLIDEIILFTKTSQGLSSKQVQFIQRTLRILLRATPFKASVSTFTEQGESGFYNQEIEQIIWLAARIKPQNTISEILMDRQHCIKRVELLPCATEVGGRLFQVGKNQPVTMR